MCLISNNFVPLLLVELEKTLAESRLALTLVERQTYNLWGGVVVFAFLPFMFFTSMDRIFLWAFTLTYLYVPLKMEHIE